LSDQMGVSRDHSIETDLRGMLGDRNVDIARFDIGYDRLRSIKSDHLDFALGACLLHAVRRPSSRKQVGTEHSC